MRKPKIDVRLIAEYILTRWKYDPETGLVFSKRGVPLGTLRKDGALQTLVFVKGEKPTSVLLHRAAYLLHTGTWPEHQVDHINGVRTDNRWANIRPATHSENRQNLSRRTKKGRLRGCTQKANGRWIAQIRAPFEKTVYIGSFSTEQEAHEAYCKAKAKIHPFQPKQR